VEVSLEVGDFEIITAMIPEDLRVDLMVELMLHPGPIILKIAQPF
jgi:hypothetical protein